MLFTFIFVCVCVCGFFVSMGRVFFNGWRVCGSLQLYQRQEFNKTNCCLCCLLFKSKIRDIFSFYSCVLWLKAIKKHVSHPRPCPKIAPHLFFILFFIYKFKYKKTAPKHFRARAVTMRVSSRCTICRTPNCRFSF